MRENEDGSWTWDLEVPVERSDAAYRSMFFSISRMMSQAKMTNPKLPGNEAVHQTGAFIAFITDGKVQEQLWEKYERLVAERVPGVDDWERRARIRGMCAEEVLTDVKQWFARFWGNSEVVGIDFVRHDDD